MTIAIALINSPWQCLGNHQNALGESPFWHPHEQMLYWVDIAGKQLLRANIYMGTVEYWDMPSEPGCMAPAESGGLVVALRDGVYRATEWGGPLQRIAQLDYDPTYLRANDGKCDAQGRFWVGTVDETRQNHNAGLYCVDARPNEPIKVTCLIDPATTPSTTANGLAWSAEGTTLYWADTPQHTVWAWDFDADTLQMTRQRIFAQWPGKPTGWSADTTDQASGTYRGRPDGAAVDQAGNYWVAMFEGQRVCQFAPDGKLLAEHLVPLRCPTMPCFGGEDLKTLYLTSASHHRSAAEREAWPLTGQVLFMRVETPGLPVNFFKD